MLLVDTSVGPIRSETEDTSYMGLVSSVKAYLSTLGYNAES